MERGPGTDDVDGHPGVERCKHGAQALDEMAARAVLVGRQAQGSDSADAVEPERLLRHVHPSRRRARPWPSWLVVYQRSVGRPACAPIRAA